MVAWCSREGQSCSPLLGPERVDVLGCGGEAAAAASGLLDAFAACAVCFEGATTTLLILLLLQLGSSRTGDSW